MNDNAHIKSVKIVPVLAIVMSLIAIVSMGRALTKGDNDGLDLHLLMWHPGHFIWQGSDPFTASLSKEQPRLPVRYWDGHTVTSGTLGTFAEPSSPTNTAPLVLLTAPLARLSWPNAVAVWKLVNVAFALLTGLLTLKLLRQDVVSFKGLLVMSTFFSLIAMREDIECGQTTTLILACMLGAVLLEPRHPLAAGILLGIAMSKYSLALPVFLLFAYRRWFKALAVSVGVQVLGVFAITAISGNPPWNVIASYTRIMARHFDSQGGIQLTAGLLKPLGILAPVLVIAGTVALFCILVYWHQGHSRTGRTEDRLIDANLLAILSLWNVLTLYHRRYDHLSTVLFIALVIVVVNAGSSKEGITGGYELSPQSRTVINVIVGFACLVWILPAYQTLGQVPYLYLYNLCDIVVLLLSVWLLFRIRNTSISVAAGLKQVVV